MIQRTKMLLVAAVVALAVVPALALASPQTAPPGHGQGHHGKPYGIEPHGNAYGFYCRGESKKHVTGMKGTPFSQCVTAMAHLATHQTTNPAKTCKALSKKHVAGMKGTPFSECVSAGNKLVKSSS